TPEAAETLQAEAAALGAELRALGHEALAGADYSVRIAELSQRLAEVEQALGRLLPKLDEERRAVAAIVDVRRRLRAAAERADNNAPSGSGEDDAADSVAALSQELARLEQGLLAIQDDQPLVPVCVDARLVAGVLAAWTGIPVGKMLVDEVHTIVNL